MMYICCFETDRRKKKRQQQQQSEHRNTNILVLCVNAYFVAIEARARNILTNDHTPTTLTTRLSRAHSIHSLYLTLDEFVYVSTVFYMKRKISVFVGIGSLRLDSHFINKTERHTDRKCVNKRSNMRMFIKCWCCVFFLYIYVSWRRILLRKKNSNNNNNHKQIGWREWVRPHEHMWILRAKKTHWLAVNIVLLYLPNEQWTNTRPE